MAFGPKGPRDDFANYVPREKITGQVPVDVFSSIIHHIKTRPYRRHIQSHHVPPHEYYSKDLLPARVTNFNASTALATQWVHTSQYPGSGKKAIFYALKWSPTGRRLLASANQGEFVVFNPNAFSMEKKTEAHTKICNALEWGRVNDLILSGDEGGIVKLWMSNLLLVAELNTNQRGVRAISYSPKEHKFVTAGSDGSARVWDTQRVAAPDASPDCLMEGHGGDVNAAEWHPFKSLVLTGSTDRDGRLWDPRDTSGTSIATLQGHTGPLTSVNWHRNGYSFLTAARDATVRLWDLRTVKQVSVFRGHDKDVLGVQWHPTHADLFTSCGMDGKVVHWVLSHDGEARSDGIKEVTKDAATIVGAHGYDRIHNTPNRVNTVAWSPVGHLLATCCHDIKFFHRNKPGAMEEVNATDGDAAGDFL